MKRNYNLMKKILEDLVFLHRNFKATRKMQPIPTIKYDNFTFSGMPYNRIAELNSIHKELKGGLSISFRNRLLMKYRGQMLCATIYDENMILGFSMHYFRDNEVEKGIIHVGYSAILPEKRGKGLMAALRQHTAKHFSANQLTGITANINKHNTSSLKAAVRGGFIVTKEPVEPHETLEVFMDLAKCSRF